MKIGVLAVQGAFIEHEHIIEKIGHEVVEIRQKKDLEGIDSKLLTITPDDELVGYKHVFQTRLTAKTKGERIRSPIGMFEANQTYMDNDAQMLLDHLHEFYN